jgi:DNA-binding FadR family transcriptional regulator
MVPLVIAAERAGLLQALEIRRALECRAAMLAAMRATPEQIEHIRLALEEMERVHKEKGAAMEEDLRFHLAVYEASGNPLFAKIISPVRGPFRVFFSQNVVGRKGFGSSAFPQHRELYDAIAARDPEASERTTIKLLDHVEDEIRAHSFP